MICPACKSKTKVAQTYKGDDVNIRIRECLNTACRHRFPTDEIARSSPPPAPVNQG